MNRHTFLRNASLLLAAAAFLLLSPACKHEKNEMAHDHAHHHAEADHDGHDAHDHDGQHAEEEHASGEIVLEPERAAKLGVKTSKIEPSDFFATLSVGGELTGAPADQSTVTARDAGIVKLRACASPGSLVSRGQIIANIEGHGMAGGDAAEAAQAAVRAAKRELDRITPLHEDGIVSTKDYNAALQAYETAKAASSNSGACCAIAPTSGVITELLVKEGQYVESGAPIATISGGNTLTLKVNVPERDSRFLSSISGARFRTAYSDETYNISDFNGKRSSTPSTVAINGYIPVYFTLTNNGALTSGSYCEVYLTGDKREGVISVPMSALSEQQGAFFVYVRLDEECYEKRPVTVGASEGDRVEILSGVNPGEEVVTEGTTFVRLAESSGTVPEGHSHSH